MITIQNLSKIYNNKYAIKDVCLNIEPGEIYGFVGPNGAGKSTTIKALLNFIFPDEGTLSIAGFDAITQNKDIKQIVGYVPSEVNFYPEQTGYDLIKLSANLHGITDFDRLNKLCDDFQVEKHKKMKALSLGNKKKIAIVCALAINPKVLIMDEPTSGLDPLIQSELFKHLKEMAQNGVTIFISSHNLREIQEHCDRVAFIKNGEILKVVLLNDYRLSGKFVHCEGEVDPLRPLAQKIISDKPNSLSFIYDGKLQDLFVALSNTALRDVSIEDLSIEHQFIELYKEEGVEHDSITH